MSDLTVFGPELLLPFGLPFIFPDGPFIGLGKCLHMVNFWPPTESHIEDALRGFLNMIEEPNFGCVCFHAGFLFSMNLSISQK